MTQRWFPQSQPPGYLPRIVIATPDLEPRDPNNGHIIPYLESCRTGNRTAPKPDNPPIPPRVAATRKRLTHEDRRSCWLRTSPVTECPPHGSPPHGSPPWSSWLPLHSATMPQIRRFPCRNEQRALRQHAEPV